MPNYHYDIPDSVLPVDQPIIETSSIEHVVGMVKYLISPRRRYLKMLALWGPTGTGKTVASFAILQKIYAVQSHTGGALVIRIEIEDERPTATEIARLIAERLMEELPPNATKYELAREIKKIIKQNDIRLIIVDEADLLDIHGLEFIRGLFKSTGCTFLLIGLEGLQKTIDRHPKFKRRMAKPVKLLPLTEDEVVHKFLPGLIFDHWKYDPKIAADIQLGKLLWGRVQPSLSALRDAIDVANDLAEKWEIEHITKKEILDGLKEVSGGRVERKKSTHSSGKKTMYERDSEERHAAKEKHDE